MQFLLREPNRRSTPPPKSRLRDSPNLLKSLNFVCEVGAFSFQSKKKHCLDHLLNILGYSFHPNHGQIHKRRHLRLSGLLSIHLGT